MLDVQRSRQGNRSHGVRPRRATWWRSGEVLEGTVPIALHALPFEREAAGRKQVRRLSYVTPIRPSVANNPLSHFERASPVKQNMRVASGIWHHKVVSHREALRWIATADACLHDVKGGSLLRGFRRSEIGHGLPLADRGSHETAPSQLRVGGGTKVHRAGGLDRPGVKFSRRQNETKNVGDAPIFSIFTVLSIGSASYGRQKAHA